MKKILFVILAFVSLFMFASCKKEVVYVYEIVDGNGGGIVDPGTGGGNNNVDTPTTDDGSIYNLTVWCAEEDVDMIWEMLDVYKKAHSANRYNFKVEPVGEDVVSSNVTRDVNAAGDVFSFANDQLGILLNQKALYQIPLTYKNQINSQIDVAITSCKSGENYYAIPYSYENCFLYYNKSLLSESDVANMETLLSKSISGVEANLAIDMADSYYTTMFLYTAGVNIFGKDGTDPNDIDLANENAVKACKYIKKLHDQPKFKSIVKADQTAALKNGNVAAMISGPHMIEQFKNALGANFGVAMLPTIKFDGDSEAKQLISFSGIKMYGVSNKPTNIRDAKTTQEACRLASFLANTSNQQTRLEKREFCPTDFELFKSAQESGLKTVEVVVSQSKYSKLKPGLSEMSAYWTPMANFLKGVYDLNKGEDKWLTELAEIEKKLKSQ